MSEAPIGAAGETEPAVQKKNNSGFVGLIVPHLVRLIDWRGHELAGCSQFRKVASWYTKALRMPKAVQHRFTMLKSLAEFDDLTAPFRESGPPPG